LEKRKTQPPVVAVRGIGLRRKNQTASKATGISRKKTQGKKKNETTTRKKIRRIEKRKFGGASGGPRN